MGTLPIADNLLFFTELVSMPVLDVRGRRIGRVKDAALVPMVNSSRIDRVLVGGGYTWLTIRYDQIRSIALGKGIVLNDEVLTPYHDDEYMLRIGRDLLDQQIIDVTGRKVVRVTDVTMGIHNDGVRARSRFWRWTSASAAFSAGSARVSFRLGGFAGCSGPFRPIPSCGISATWWRPTRCGGCG
jgi:sporulation protein YlmC with PRC-barrel domain